MRQDIRAKEQYAEYCSEECQAEAKRLRKKRQLGLINGIEPIMDLQHQEYLTFSKAAILMGCTRQYIYKLVANGKLKTSRLSSRMAFVRKTDIEKMFEGNPYKRVIPANKSKPCKKAKAEKPTQKQEPIKGKVENEVLDYNPSYRDESTMKVIRHESLGIYIYAKPKNQTEQKYSLNLTARAEAIRCRRFEAIVNERYDFFDKEKMKGDFLAYFKRLADKKNSKWQHVYMHFRTFTQGKCTFDEINVDLCNRFREYLLTAPQGLHKNRKLHINSAANYWSTFRASIHTAYRDRKIKENPNGFLERIETIPTDKEHLSQDEVIRLASTPCSAPALKRAFLFSCLTALRKSDIKKLTWEEIQPYVSTAIPIMEKANIMDNNTTTDVKHPLFDFKGCP